MSHLPYHAYNLFGRAALTTSHYSQAVTLPSTGTFIQTSGQGGWDRARTNRDLSIPTDLAAEIEQAFDNVDATIKDAGGKGMEQVYKLVVYAAPCTEEGTRITVACMKKWFPNHKPLLTLIGIDKLALPGMRVEIEGFAHLP